MCILIIFIRFALIVEVKILSGHLPVLAYSCVTIVQEIIGALVCISHSCDHLKWIDGRIENSNN